MVTPGSFVLHNAVRPAVPDGAYQLTVTQELDPPGQQVDALDKHLVVTGPRFALPPDQTLSSYPPDNASGDFQTRLPQIVLRRRTLPWERYIDSTDTQSPWLALVVLADGEGQLTTGQPVNTAGLTDPDLRDSDTRDVLTVSERVVQQVFPTRDDLPWLCHVREVDLSDTELALGDDDGWLAVVLANRLPQPGLKYTACLVSLEGHGDDLPAEDRRRPRSRPSGCTRRPRSPPRQSCSVRASRRSTCCRSEPRRRATPRRGWCGSPCRSARHRLPTLVGARIPATAPAVSRDAWSALDVPASRGRRSAVGREGQRDRHRCDQRGRPVDPSGVHRPRGAAGGVHGPQARSFTCGRGWRLRIADPRARRRHARHCPPDPTPRPRARRLPHRRRGRIRWSRTRVTCHRERSAAAATRSGVVPAASRRGRSCGSSRTARAGSRSRTQPDQARRVGPDGREDLSLAAGVSRDRPWLLAVAQSAVVAGLLARRQSGTRRRACAWALTGSRGSAGALLGILGQNRPVSRCRRPATS